MSEAERGMAFSGEAGGRGLTSISIVMSTGRIIRGNLSTLNRDSETNTLAGVS